MGSVPFVRPRADSEGRPGCSLGLSVDQMAGGPSPSSHFGLVRNYPFGPCGI